MTKKIAEKTKTGAKTKTTIQIPKDDFARSIAGFFAALIVGALIPRTLTYLVKRIVLRSFREVFMLAAAGWLTDRLAQLLVRSKPSKERSSK